MNLGTEGPNSEGIENDQYVHSVRNLRLSPTTKNRNDPMQLRDFYKIRKVPGLEPDWNLKKCLSTIWSLCRFIILE